MSIRRFVLILLCVALLLVWQQRVRQPETHFWEYTSGEYLMDHVYASMQGPGEVKRGVYLGNREQAELLWLTGYRASMVDSTGQHQLDQEFMCHNSLFLDGSVERHRKSLGTRPYGSRRLFTLAHGAEDLSFPEGFALPLLSTAGLQLQSQSLNLLPEHIGQVVRHRIQARFQLDSELSVRPKPLFLMEATGRILVRDLSGGQAPTGVPASGPVRKTPQGEVWSGHWEVPPGPATNISRVTQELKVPFPTRVHFATAHLHPYARWQELRQAQTGRVLFRITPTLTPDGQSLKSVPAYSSSKGVAISPGVEYDLVTHYENTSDKTVTAMSILFLYCRDQEFRGAVSLEEGPEPETAAPAPAADDFCGQLQ